MTTIPIEELKRVCRLESPTWEEKCLLLQWYIRLETGFWFPDFHTYPCSNMELFEKNHNIARNYFKTFE